MQYKQYYTKSRNKLMKKKLKRFLTILKRKENMISRSDATGYESNSNAVILLSNDNELRTHRVIDTDTYNRNK